MFCGIHLRAISQEWFQNICLETALSHLLPHVPRINVLICIHYIPNLNFHTYWTNVIFQVISSNLLCSATLLLKLDSLVLCLPNCSQPGTGMWLKETIRHYYTLSKMLRIIADIQCCSVQKESIVSWVWIWNIKDANFDLLNIKELQK